MGPLSVVKVAELAI